MIDGEKLVTHFDKINLRGQRTPFSVREREWWSSIKKRYLKIERERAREYISSIHYVPSGRTSRPFIVKLSFIKPTSKPAYFMVNWHGPGSQGLFSFKEINKHLPTASTRFHIWRECNRRGHGENPTPSARLANLIDKNIRNRFSSTGNQGDYVYTYDDGLTLWFATLTS